MNIFFIDRCPVKAARYQVDRHVVAMIRESAQMLSTAHRVLDGTLINKKWLMPDQREEVLYKATHINHPSTVWARTSKANYSWLYDHMMALGDEYTYRYDRVHATISRLASVLKELPHNLMEEAWSEPALAMPDEYKLDDAVDSYRNFYIKGKEHLHKWKRRSMPEWISDARDANDI